MAEIQIGGSKVWRALNLMAKILNEEKSDTQYYDGYDNAIIDCMKILTECTELTLVNQEELYKKNK